MEYIESACPEADISGSLSEYIGKTVTLNGSIYRIRKMGALAFILLSAGRRLVQCVWSAEFSRFPLESLRENMCVRATGEAARKQGSAEEAELRLTEVEVLSAPEEEPPFAVNKSAVNASLDTLLDYRPLTLRNARERAIFKIQEGICAGFRRFLGANGFTEIHTPKIVAAAAESGASVFGLDYFGRTACLAQSPQLYKQIMVGVFGRVYEIAPVFRAEKHRTSRHLNEYTSVDLEMGYIRSYRDLMALEAAMISDALGFLKRNCAYELELLKAEMPLAEKIPAIGFRDAKALIASEYRRTFADAEDFEPEEERLLCEHVKAQTGSDFVFVTGYKASKRPFYVMDTPGDPECTESFDLLFRGVEVTTGGQRIHGYREQIEKMRARGMDEKAFESYLQAHRYGLPPHGGLGLGLERFTARLLNLPNVRNATLFPRDTERLEP